MQCVLCGREEGDRETRDDHVRAAFIQRNKKFARGYYNPVWLSMDERTAINGHAPGEVAICNNRVNCRKRKEAADKAVATLTE